jgi:hypothetical protein
VSDRALRFATLAATVYAAHSLADHVLGQTDAQAAAKALPGREGWLALAHHVGQYHAVMAAMVAVTAKTTGLPVRPGRLAAGLAISVATHALWDRRRPVVWVLDHTGSAPFARLSDHGLNGAYLADQSLHVGCLWLAALVASGGIHA